MKPEIKARWVAALRSGEYKQGTDRLKTPNGEFCCLGVLCDLYHKEKTAGIWDGSGNLDGIQLPASCVMDWAGLLSDNPDVLAYGVSGPLSAHNDGDYSHGPLPFSEIADAIEAQL